jgi:hypothetical protein
MEDLTPPPAALHAWKRIEEVRDIIRENSEEP